MMNEISLPDDQTGSTAEDAGPEARRHVRMTRIPGQALVLSSLGGFVGDAGPIEIRFAEAGAGGATTLDFLLPDSFFVEHKETMDSMQALFCLRPPCRDSLSD